MLEIEVQSIVGETSEMFVPNPSREEVITDAIKGLRRFKDNLRWKEYFKIKQQESKREEESKKRKREEGMDEEEEESIMDEEMTSSEEEEEEESEERRETTKEGLGTKLKPNKFNLTAPKGTEPLEAFLKAVEEEVLNLAFKYSEKETTTPRAARVKELQVSLRKEIYKADRRVRRPHPGLPALRRRSRLRRRRLHRWRNAGRLRRDAGRRQAGRIDADVLRMLL